MKDRKILCPRCGLGPLRLLNGMDEINGKWTDIWLGVDDSQPRTDNFRDIRAVKFVCDDCEWASSVYRPREPDYDHPFIAKQYEDDVYDHISLLHNLPAHREYREKKKASWNKFLAELAVGAGHACCGI